MADSLKLLVSTDANRLPSGTSAVTLYTVPAGRTAVLSRILIANVSGSTATFRIAITPSGVTLATQHYIAYDISLAAGDAINMPIGAGMEEGDFISVRTSTGSAITFAAFGTELV